MTGRGFAVLVMDAAFFASALASGRDVLYLAAVFAALVLCYAFISVLAGFFTLRCDQRFERTRLLRGEDLRLEIRFPGFFVLPLGRLEADVSLCGVRTEQEIPVKLFGRNSFSLEVRAPHVGVFRCGAEQIRICDLFGLFRFKKNVSRTEKIAVLPRPFPLEEALSPAGNDGSSALGRAGEDLTDPDGTRDYQPGDLMKRVHWKLSARRRKMAVRTYAMPAPPDTLILFDPSVPPCGDAEKRAVLRDTLAETCMAAAVMQLRDLSPVRVPFYFGASGEFSAEQESEIPLLQEMLAESAAERQADYAQILRNEAQRVRRAGAAVMITAALDPEITEAVIAVRRAGPAVRLYLITEDPDREELIPMVISLQRQSVEVCYVTPA